MNTLIVGLAIGAAFAVVGFSLIRSAIVADRKEAPAPRRDEFEFSPQFPPATFQKGDPDGASWPWELTENEGPRD